MDTLMSLPMTASVLTEYGDLEEACRSCGCDGLEVVWGGEELPCTVPQALHVGYHLTFYPDWLDFWRGDRAALTEKFGSEEVWRSFYGGPEGRETLLRLYREDLDRAVTWGARYVVFHVSDVSVEEGFTYHWRHTHEEVIDAAAEVINLLLGDRAWPFDFLVENQWWPGFTFTEPELTRRLLDGIRAERAGYRASDELRHQPAYPGGRGGLCAPHAGPAWRSLPVHQGDSSSLLPQRGICPGPYGFSSSGVASGLFKAVRLRLPPYPAHRYASALDFPCHL